MATVLDMWIADRTGEVRPQSLRIYRDTVRWLSPLIGGLTLEDMSASRIKVLLATVEQDRSLAAVHAVRVALNGALGIAVELDAIQHNPIRSLRRRKPVRRIPKALNVAQVNVLREVILEREQGAARHGGAGAPMLRWVVEVMLGSGLQISEVLALRNTDVDLDRGTISVTGTIAEDDHWVLFRQEELKSRDQARTITLPRYAVRVLQEARSAQNNITSRLPLSPAIPGRRGNVVYPRGIRRALCVLREHPRMVNELASTGLGPEDLKPHILRRTGWRPGWWCGFPGSERRIVDVRSHRGMVSENRSKLLTKDTNHD
ncbi:site-specific integrase, partial [Microbacterium sp.]|uniref:site-specific integrase n=1 Tax=Microbacterium sp. TaxID=51671 RepID=UPI0039E4A720